MTRCVIKAENLSKIYRIGELGTGTVSYDLERWWAKLRGKEDPYLKVGQTNIRTEKGTSNIVYSLQDINFEIEQGTAVGVIGKNSAGKSTLLKILSRVTSPTTGQIKIKGRVASLLEVGTGFHPELTGRENIYLNGAILGMTKAEIASKFDEIVDFSGVERYIDTPVKRYSSGMYVRLAFAVAAHLEPDILVVDEVLAVGDVEFQRKAISKMQDVSTKEGITVLFVSHNMASIQTLCQQIIYLEHGMLKKMGPTNEVISMYLSSKQIENLRLQDITNRNGNGCLRFTDGKISDVKAGTDWIVETFSDIKIQLHYQLMQQVNVKQARIDIGINNLLGDRVAWMSTELVAFNPNIQSGVLNFYIDHLPLSPGDYTCNLYCQINNEVADWITDVLSFSIAEKDYYNTGKNVPPKQGNILLDFRVDEIR